MVEFLAKILVEFFFLPHLSASDATFVNHFKNFVSLKLLILLAF